VAGNRLTDMEHRGDIGLQQAFEGIGREILKRGAVLHSGIVHEDVDGIACSFEPIHGRAHGRMIGRVKGKRLRAGDQGCRCL
jgi:hypothetical protein